MIKFNTHFKNFKHISIISFTCFFSFFVSADRNIDKLNIPEGFEVSIFADELETPRQITETNSGFIIVV